MVATKNVSTPAMCLFICAICSSYSKSVPVRSPLTIAVKPAGLHEVDDETLTGFHPQVGQVRRRLLDHRDAFVEVEHALLVGVDQHGDHDLVELGRGALEDVDMAEGHRVERPGTYRAAHGPRRYQGSSGPLRSRAGGDIDNRHLEAGVAVAARRPHLPPVRPASAAGRTPPLSTTTTVPAGGPAARRQRAQHSRRPRRRRRHRADRPTPGRRARSAPAASTDATGRARSVAPATPSVLIFCSITAAAR